MGWPKTCCLLCLGPSLVSWSPSLHSQAQDPQHSPSFEHAGLSWTTTEAKNTTSILQLGCAFFVVCPAMLLVSGCFELLHHAACYNSCSNDQIAAFSLDQIFFGIKSPTFCVEYTEFETFASLNLNDGRIALSAIIKCFA